MVHIVNFKKFPDNDLGELNLPQQGPYQKVGI